MKGGDLGYGRMYRVRISRRTMAEGGKRRSAREGVAHIERWGTEPAENLA